MVQVISEFLLNKDGMRVSTFSKIPVSSPVKFKVLRLKILVPWPE